MADRIQARAVRRCGVLPRARVLRATGHVKNWSGRRGPGTRIEIGRDSVLVSAPSGQVS
jgi:hypothetical protein